MDVLNPLLGRNISFKGQKGKGKDDMDVPCDISSVARAPLEGSKAAKSMSSVRPFTNPHCPSE
eukprot:601301-Prorocentrum_minimum.AAC.1